MFVLQVFSEEAREPLLDCASLCEQVDTGFAGICCGQEYCDCDSGSDLPLECPPDEQFCDEIGDCVPILGQECAEAEYCCAGNTSTTTRPDDSYAVLITGSGNSAGNTTELYQPSSGVSCSVGTLPMSRSLHTLESSGLMCGGYGAENSCLHWSPDTGIWEETLSLDVGRYLHVSWTPGTDTFLMGGYTSNRTTTLIKPDGTQEPGFDLKYDTYYACAIPDTEDTVVLTGGVVTQATVSVYSLQGWQEDLSPLNTGRFQHACSSYMSGGRRMYLVTGGWDGSQILDSTEVFDPSVGSWTLGAKLPWPVSGMRAININDRVLIFGGENYIGTSHYYDDILEYDPEEDSMVTVGHLTQTRAWHAISVVQAEDYSMWCQ